MYNNIEKSYTNEARKAPKREAVKDYKLQENFKFELSQAFLCHLKHNSNNVDNVYTIKCIQI